MNLRLSTTALAFVALSSLAAAGESNLTALGPLGGSCRSVVVDPLDPDRILLTKFTVGFFLSIDGGVSFEQIPTTLSQSVGDFVQDPNNGQVLYAVDGNSIYKSLDFGATWNPLGLVSSETLKDVAVATTGGGMLAVDAFNIHHSSDFGANWTTTALIVPFSGTILEDVSFAPSDPQRAYYSASDGIFASTDGGVSWFDPQGFSTWVKAFAVSPTDADTIFVGTPFSGVHRSTDGGAGFTNVTSSAVDDNAVFFAWEPDGSRLWYATLQGLAYTTDSGNQWIDATAGLFPNPMPIPITLGFDGSGKRYLGAEGNALGSSTGGGLYRMTGAQTTWEHIGFLDDNVFAGVVASPGGRRVLGLGSGAWVAQPGQPFLSTAWGAETRAIAIDPDNSNRWVIGGVGSFFDNAQIVTLTGNGTAAALRYEQFGAGTVQAIVFDPSNSDHAVAGIFPGGFGNEAILFTTNAGNAWTEVAGTIGWATRDVAFDPHTPGRVLQLSDNGQWAQSLDSGITWGALQTAWPTTGSSIFLAFDPHVPGQLYRGEAGQGLWRSSDAGASWTALGVALTAGAEIAFDPLVAGKFWIGNAGGDLLVSVDAGATFTSVTSIPGAVNITSVAHDAASGKLLLGTAGSSAWELADGTPFPIVYCTAKTSSAGCVASIASSEPASQPTSGAGDTFVLASGVQNAKVGLLFAGTGGVAALPFNGGTLCMTPPLKRGPILFSAGSSLPASDCSGSFSTLINDGVVIPAGLDAGSGVTATYQYWYRDPQGGAGSLGTALSNALLMEFE